MSEWKLDGNLLSLEVDGKTFNLSGDEILDIEDGKTVEIGGSIAPKVSSQLHQIDFGHAWVRSTIKAQIYVPQSKNELIPWCQFKVVDSFFKSHDIPFLPSDYIVADNLFLILDPDQVAELKTSFKSHASGPIGYKQIALIQKNLSSNEYITFVESDEHCEKRAPDSHAISNVRSRLYPYQLAGVQWMGSVLDDDAGFVLADEMGLGKTVQIITVIDEQRGKGPSLLIAPNSLMENWSREIQRFAPWLSFTVDAGKTREHNYRRLLDYSLVITSYDVARVDFMVLGSIDWNLIVLDEAQNIKNYGTHRSKEIRKYPKRSGIAVTGTPLENHITDIWSIYDFCFPGLLGDVKAFKSEFGDDFDSAEKLERIITPIMLRRRSKDVLKDLPDKVITPIALEMNPDEAEGYERIRMEAMDEDGRVNPGILTTLRMYCALPEIVDNDFKSTSPADTSAKFAYLFEGLLDKIYSQKEKVIIFTGWVQAQEKIQSNVRARYGSFCDILNGDVPIDERQKMIDEFSERIGFAVLIINPTVGATGLNITAANHVIFYTLDWNPATEDQCIARAARIGQKKTVFVYRLFYSDTIEDEVNDCLEHKRKLQDTTVKGTTADVSPDVQKALGRGPFLRRKS